MALILFLPLLISVVSFLIPKKVVKEMGLAFSATFLGYLVYLILFEFEVSRDFAIAYQVEIIPSIGAILSLGLDGISIMLVTLTNLVVLYVNIIALNKDYDSKFYGLVFLMQFALIGVFSSLNAIFFYVFWELALIPIYLILMLYGQGTKLRETFVRFFIYTFIGSLFILAAFIFVHIHTKSTFYNGFDYLSLVIKVMSPMSTSIFLIMMFVGFGVKIPIFPLHSWQSSTYRKAPVEGTILLSAIMLKMGLYGLIRWWLPFYSPSAIWVQHIAIVLSLVGLLYGAIIALRRNDLKLIAAFSSLSHVGMISAGILTTSIYGIQGAVIQMIVHGINILGLFYIIEIIERTTGTRNIQNLGGIASKAPKFAILSLIIILGSISVPLTNGFPGEMMLLMSLYFYHPVIGIVAGLSIVFGAAYMLRVYQLSFFRDLSADTQNFEDIKGLDFVALAFIAVLVIAMGIFPQTMIHYSEVAANHLKNFLAVKY